MLSNSNQSIDDGQTQTPGPDNNTVNEPTSYIKPSGRFRWASRLSIISYIILCSSFFSDRWLSSYLYSNSEFLHMGLWKFCFRNYDHDGFHVQSKHNGCKYIIDSTFEGIYHWLTPIWLRFVQIFMTLAFIIHLFVIILEAIIFMGFFRKRQFSLILLVTNALSITSLLLLLASTVFYLEAFDKNWIKNSENNYFDRDYYLVICSISCNIVAFYVFKLEIKRLEEIKIQRHKLGSSIPMSPTSTAANT